MVVSPRTIQEYKVSLDSFLRKARQVPQLMPELAVAALQATGDEDTLTAYWQQIRTKGAYVDPRVFYDRSFPIRG